MSCEDGQCEGCELVLAGLRIEELEAQLAQAMNDVSHLADSLIEEHKFTERLRNKIHTLEHVNATLTAEVADLEARLRYKRTAFNLLTTSYLESEQERDTLRQQVEVLNERILEWRTRAVSAEAQNNEMWRQINQDHELLIAWLDWMNGQGDWLEGPTEALLGRTRQMIDTIPTNYTRWLKPQEAPTCGSDDAPSPR